jgi:hypothetical protein
MIDCTAYTNNNFLQLLKKEAKYQQIIAHADYWQEVVYVIDSLGLKYTEEQLDFVKQKQWY